MEVGVAKFHDAKRVNVAVFYFLISHTTLVRQLLPLPPPSKLFTEEHSLLPQNIAQGSASLLLQCEFLTKPFINRVHKKRRQ